MVWSTRRFVLCLTLCNFVLVFFSPFSNVITSVGEERATQCFSYVCSICTCLVLYVSSSAWCLGRAAVCDCGTSLTFLRKAFSNFYRRHSALVEKYSVNLKKVLQQRLSEPEFYGNIEYRFRKVVGKSNFSEQFRKLNNRYKRIGYSLDIMRQTACLVVNTIIVDGHASLFKCTTAVRASDSMTASS